MAKENEHHEHPGENQTHSAQSPYAQEVTSLNARPELIAEDTWGHLRRFTQARIALGRTGASLPTAAQLNFDAAQALARDAVHKALDVDSLCNQLKAAGFATLAVHSRAQDRHSFLLRPDLGRRLEPTSLHRLEQHKRVKPIDLLLVIGDGLSALAIERHALPLLDAVRELLPADWQIGPLVVAEQARVALADEIGETLGARLVAMLIGERPGLSSPDSLGIYLTYNPSLNCNDSNRNCISNVRPEGLSYTSAAQKLIWLCREARRLKLSGVNLKDESDNDFLPEAELK